MPLDVDRLQEIVEATTTMYRKGPEVSEDTVGGLTLTEVFTMSHESHMPPQDGETVTHIDVHFAKVAVDLVQARARRAALIRLMRAYPDQEELRSGPNYLVVGAELGSQELALRLFALGQALHLWMVVTPALFGIKGARADEFAGVGFVMLAGYDPNRR